MAGADSDADGSGSAQRFLDNGPQLPTHGGRRHRRRFVQPGAVPTGVQHLHIRGHHLRTGTGRLRQVVQVSSIFIIQRSNGAKGGGGENEFWYFIDFILPYYIHILLL